MFHRMHKVVLSLAAATLVSASPALARVYYMDTYGEQYGENATEWVTDIVTDAFMQRFPYQKYSIVVIVDDFQLGDDTVCYARAGISARPKGKLSSRVPSRYFASMQIIRNSAPLRRPEKRDCLKSVVRHVVQNMMNGDMETLAKASADSLVE
jgi:hypothetical protein